MWWYSARNITSSVGAQPYKRGVHTSKMTGSASHPSRAECHCTWQPSTYVWRRARDPVHSTRVPRTSPRTRANVCANSSSGGDALAPPLPPLTPTRYKSSSCKPYFGTISVSVFIANLRIRNDTPETSSTVKLIADMFRMFGGGCCARYLC